jgi:hypothetical protein
MISIKRTYNTARRRLDELPKRTTPAETFVLTVFFIEKILRRTLVQLVILKGSPHADAFETVKTLRGLHAVRDTWKKYDAKKQTLESVIGADAWAQIKEAAKLRNELVHGSGYQAEKVYRKLNPALLKCLDSVVTAFTKEYGYAGWRGMRDATGKKI